MGRRRYGGRGTTAIWGKGDDGDMGQGGRRRYGDDGYMWERRVLYVGRGASVMGRRRYEWEGRPQECFSSHGEVG